MGNTINPYLSSQSKRNFDIFVASLTLPLSVGGVALGAIADIKHPTTLHERIAPDGSTIYIHKTNVTRLGRLGVRLIDTGLDELPQLMNVLGGSMSIVGPRGLRAEDRDAFLSGLPKTLRDTWLEHMQGMKAGIISTYGLASHAGAPASDRAAMDIYDAQHASLRHDIGLLKRIGRAPVGQVVVSLDLNTDDSDLSSVAESATYPVSIEPPEETVA